MSLPEKESLTVEFKSDRNRLPDKDLIEEIVGLTNTEGGDLYLGVEDDGIPTGLHPKHADITGWVYSLDAMITSVRHKHVTISINCDPMRKS